MRPLATPGQVNWWQWFVVQINITGYEELLAVLEHA